MLRGFLAGGENILIVYSLASVRIVEVAGHVPSAASGNRRVVRSADAVEPLPNLRAISQGGWQGDGRVDHQQTQGQIRIACTKLKRDRAAHAVADDYRL